jgi:hypothetical protein
MATLGMLGSYDFNAPEIDRVVTKTSPGNYALGYVKEYNFYVKYIGRSDSDVNKELKARLPLKHLKFKYSYATSAKAAFEKECQNYHAFGGSEGLENRVHPNCPIVANWECPRCDIFS